jgi:dynein heavy chain
VPPTLWNYQPLTFCSCQFDPFRCTQAGGGVIPTTVYFSAQTSAATVQAQLEAQLEKKRKRRFGAPAGRRLLMFVDDVNLPARDAASGAQPPIELLRHLQDFRRVVFVV